MSKAFKALTTCLVSLALAAAVPAYSAAAADIPAPSLKVPPMVPEKSVSTYVHSESAPGQGLAVNVIYPQKPRYSEGAPVVVVAPTGDAPSGLEFSVHTAQSGFVEVRFAFPGGGKPGFQSSGKYDFRGQRSQEALKDVLLFAAGKLTDSEGRTIDKLVPVKLYHPCVGIIGWSNGGNIAMTTLAKYSEQLSPVGWLVFYETPLGSLFFPPTLGGAQDFTANRHYRLGSAATGMCLVDFRKLCFQPTGQKSPGAHKKAGMPEIDGVLFFDENGNHQWDEEIEFALPYSSLPGLNKQIYPPAVTQALMRLGIFNTNKSLPVGIALDSRKAGWPDSIANLAWSEKYFQERDGSQYLNDVAKARPDLLVCVYGCRLDHLQRQSDHPHIVLNYNGWLANRMKFVRLNPEPLYVGGVANMNGYNFKDNKPNASIDATEIEDYLEPEGILPHYVYIEAAAAELSDRLKLKNYKETMSAPLVIYANGALPPNYGTKSSGTAPSGKAPVGNSKAMPKASGTDEPATEKGKSEPQQNGNTKTGGQPFAWPHRSDPQ
jgi:hypothetical protein